MKVEQRNNTACQALLRKVCENRDVGKESRLVGATGGKGNTRSGSRPSRSCGSV